PIQNTMYGPAVVPGPTQLSSRSCGPNSGSRGGHAVMTTDEVPAPSDSNVLPNTPQSVPKGFQWPLPGRNNGQQIARQWGRRIPKSFAGDQPSPPIKTLAFRASCPRVRPRP